LTLTRISIGREDPEALLASRARKGTSGHYGRVPGELFRRAAAPSPLNGDVVTFDAAQIAKPSNECMCVLRSGRPGRRRSHARNDRSRATQAFGRCRVRDPDDPRYRLPR
jgi:hypothetical protein